MKLIRYGTEGAKKILALPGLFADEKSLQPLIEELKDHAEIYVAVYNGYANGNGIYIDGETEAAAIINAAKDLGVETFDVLYANTFGAAIALKILEKAPWTAKKTFLDGGLFFNVPKLVQMGLLKAVLSFTDDLKSKDEEEGMKQLMSHSLMEKFVGKPGKGQEDLFRNMTGVIHGTDRDTIKKMLETCMSFRYPKLSDAEQQKIFFLYSKDEPAYHDYKDVTSHYPKANMLVMEGYSYCGFLTEKTADYADLLLTIL